MAPIDRDEHYATFLCVMRLKASVYITVRISYVKAVAHLNRIPSA